MHNISDSGTPAIETVDLIQKKIQTTNMHLNIYFVAHRRDIKKKIKQKPSLFNLCRLFFSLYNAMAFCFIHRNSKYHLSYSEKPVCMANCLQLSIIGKCT